MNHPPPYNAHRDRERPKVNWDLPNGSWVGIWGYDWHDLIGGKVLEVSKDIEYEVWQPDLRADKVYVHTFDNGLTHKLFPAQMKNYTHGLHLRKDVVSKSLMQELDKEIKKNKQFVLHINAGFRSINIPILKKYSKKIPIVGQFYTNSIDTFRVPKTKNILKLANAYLKNFELRKYYRKFKYIIPSVKEGVDYFEKEFGIKVFHRNFGNFGRNNKEWERDKSKLKSREMLGIDEKKFILLSSSRLIEVKQIDKMLEAFAKVNSNSFVCYISGRGTEAYEKYLNDIIEKNNLKGKIKFIGYVDFDVLKDYFQAADLIISTSYMEAGPAPVMHAASLGIPIILTATGIGYEFYKQHNVGLIVPVDDYKKWTEEIENVINGKRIEIPKKEDVEKFSDQKKISQYYYNIYKEVLKQ